MKQRETGKRKKENGTREIRKGKGGRSGMKRAVAAAVVAVPIAVSLFSQNPAGTSVESPWHNVSSLEFIYDLTYMRDGERVYEQSILEEELELIREAREFIVADMFLFNDEYDRSKGQYPKISERLADALLEKKAQNPKMPIVLITDPINNFYGAYLDDNLARLREGGVQVVVTDLNKLKDSNFLYSGYYRFFLKWFGTEGRGWITNPFDPDGPEVNIRSLLKLANFKANHRKLLVTEREGLVASANPHDASGRHSNVAVRVDGGVLGEMAEAESVVAAFSGLPLPERLLKQKGLFVQAGPPSGGPPSAGTPSEGPPSVGAPSEGAPSAGAPSAGTPSAGTPSEGAPSEGTPSEGAPSAGTPSEADPFGEGPGDYPALPGAKVRYLTEEGIFNGLMERINAAGQGDEIQIGIFYIADTALVKGLEEAAKRGAQIKIVADPNKDAFGMEKDGSPNRIVLSDLKKKSGDIQIRWYDTHGEQYHTKMAYFSFPDKDVTILGSCNYTRRNLRGLNLESDLEVVTAKNSDFSKDVADYFERIWNNRDGEYTLDFSAYEETSPLKRIQYWIQEPTGLCTY